jgi:hypothetical protein
MKNKKNVYALIVVLIFIIYIVFSNLSFIGKDKIKTQNVLTHNSQTENIIKQDALLPSAENPSQPPLIKGGDKLVVKNPSQPSLIKEGENIPNTQNIQVTLNVLDKTYKANIKEGATLYDAMSNIQSVKDNNFTFSGKEFPSLGFFVEEINGIKYGSGKYWLYYVNGKEASVGVSKYVLKEGDIISWKQE